MRLINTRTLHLEEHHGDMSGQYAILSHTWGNDEVTFQDVTTDAEDLREKMAYQKIVKTCSLALEDGLSYAWIDTWWARASS